MKVEDHLKTQKALPPKKKLIINLMLACNHASSKMTEVIKPFDISLPQFNVLRILRGQKGKPANLGTIQERMINQMSNTTRLVDKLLDKKYVERSVCEENRRKIEIFITKDGLDLLKEIDPVFENAEHSISDNLSLSEIQHLNELLDKLRA